jgi:hypothetical protein
MFPTSSKTCVLFCTLSCLWHTYQTELTVSEVQTRTRTLQFHVTLGTAEWSIPSRGGHLTISGIHLDKAKHAEAKQHIGVSWSQVPSLQILVKKVVTFTGISKFKGTGCKPYRISRKDSAGANRSHSLGGFGKDVQQTERHWEPRDTRLAHLRFAGV